MLLNRSCAQKRSLKKPGLFLTALVSVSSQTNVLSPGLPCPPSKAPCPASRPSILEYLQVFLPLSRQEEAEPQQLFLPTTAAAAAHREVLLNGSNAQLFKGSWHLLLRSVRQPDDFTPAFHFWSVSVAMQSRFVTRSHGCVYVTGSEWIQQKKHRN